MLAILVILGSFVTVATCASSRTQAGDAARGQIGMLEGAVQHYALDVGTRPDGSRIAGPARGASDLKNVAMWAGPYLNKEVPLDPWEQQYQYEQLSAEEFRRRLVLTGNRARKTISIRLAIGSREYKVHSSKAQGLLVVLRRGFTLIEMLLVLAILVVVAAVAPALRGVMQNASRTRPIRFASTGPRPTSRR